MSFRLELYRSFCSGFVTQWVLPRICGPERLEAGGLQAFSAGGPPPDSKHRRDRAWFHAASVGELESLWTVIRAWLNSSPSRDAIVTILSESAADRLLKFRAEIDGAFGPELGPGLGPGRIVYSGYCPWEGNWGVVLDVFKPGVFVTAKYEAWPELWASLAKSGIPLVIVGAKTQRSLRLAKRVSRWMGVPLPRMHLLTADARDVPALHSDFQEAEIRCCGEPRWDRVRERLRDRNLRASALADRLAGLPRPWLVLGSVWPEDLKLWRLVLRDFAGTPWVVPHRVDEASLRAIQDELSEDRIWQFSSKSLEASGSQPAGVVVDEMGILSELYQFADLAYVGGGLGAGVHSTIEPALPGLPVSAGPRGREKFAEIPQLLQTGQLTLVESSEDAAEWVNQVLAPGAESRRSAWAAQAEGRMGASARILEALDELLKACYS